VTKSTKRRWLLLSIGTLLTLLTGCSGGTSTSPAGSSSPVRTSSPTPEVVMPSAPQAVPDETDYGATLALAIVDTFKSDFTAAGQRYDVEVSLTEPFLPGNSVGLNVLNSLEGSKTGLVLFRIPAVAGGEVQATFTLLDPQTNAPSGHKLAVFFTSTKIQTVFLVGNDAPVELTKK
jgi:hypothetical protein